MNNTLETAKQNYKPTYQHIHINNLTCQRIEITAKGYAVLQKQGKKKPVMKFYQDSDFIGNWAIWKSIK